MIHYDSNILNDITNFFLVVLGITITLFTVIYSFIINKRDELIKINEDINKGKSTPYIQQKRNFNLLYIKNFIKWNDHLIIVGIFSLLSFIICFITNRLITNEHIQLYLFNISIVLFILTLLYLIVTLVYMYLNFKKKTKL